LSTGNHILDIVLPHYGDVGLLQAAVRSILGQDDDRWRLTVVDDSAEPGLPEWFAGLGDPRVRYERNERNLGITANFQKCLDRVEYERMVMMGSDDIMLPGYVRRVRELAQRHPQAAIIQPGVEIIGSDGTRIRPLVDRAKTRIYRPSFSGTIVLGGEELAASLLRGNWMYFPALCWRSSELKAVGFDQRHRIVQDLAAILAILERGGEVVLDDEVCFQYRRHASSVSSAGAVQGSRFREEADFFEEMAAHMAARGWPRAASAARWHSSSRLHALTMVPRALRAGDLRGLATLSRHVGGRGTS
jgi:glycosyltransferase involved in cell wall biosynthesis